jgi:carbamoyltransferase
MNKTHEPWVLGISASHNGAACLLKGDSVVVAIQEERLTRHKRHRISGAKPALSIAYCLDYAGIGPDDLDLVVLGCQEPQSSIENDILLNPQLRLASRRIPTLSVSHHLAHAISAYATSGFEESAILVVDGMGSPWEDVGPDERAVAAAEERGGWETISLYAAEDYTFTPLAKHLVRDGKWLVSDSPRMPRFGSLGGMFSAAAKQIFDNHMEAGKVMGLAAYGKPEINSSEFYLIQNERFLFSDAVCSRFTDAVRWPRMEAEYKVLAASVQAALEEALLYLVSKLRALCSSTNLCFSGGVALNSVANERLVRESEYSNIHFFPAAEDSGIAVGAAFYGLMHLKGTLPRKKISRDAYGRRYHRPEVLAAVEAIPGVEVQDCPDPIDYAAEMLSQGKVLGWLKEGAELGPRALGQRSILFDPRRPDGKDFLNYRVKHREAFRPFAPACLAEEAESWFELTDSAPESPFMMRACRVRASMGSRIPAVVHVDGSARVQTLTKEDNGTFYDLVRRFYDKTGVPIVLNTSFNIAGEPLVETPADALWCLLATGLDGCVIEGTVVVKRDPGQSLLDLYPQLVSQPVTVVTTVDNVASGRYSDPQDYIKAVCQTPWGAFERFFPWSVVRILERIDGLTSARAIFAGMHDGDETFSELDFTQFLLQLGHAGLVTCAEAPCGM